MRLPAALGLGLLLGVVDLAWLQLVPGPLSDLGDSGAVWVLAAWLAATRGAAPAGHRLGTALAVLVGAVAGYYLAGAFVLGDGWADVVDPGALVYLVLGLVGGLGTGVAAVLWRGPRPTVVRALGLAVVPALLLCEAWLRADLTAPTSPVNPRGPGDLVVPALLVLGAAAVLLADRAHPRRAGLAAVLAVPLAAVGVGAWDVVGIGGV